MLIVNDSLEILGEGKCCKSWDEEKTLLLSRFYEKMHQTDARADRRSLKLDLVLHYSQKTDDIHGACPCLSKCFDMENLGHLIVRYFGKNGDYIRFKKSDRIESIYQQL